MTICPLVRPSGSRTSGVLLASINADELGAVPAKRVVVSTVPVGAPTLPCVHEYE